jgi:hypothetical protein
MQAVEFKTQIDNGIIKIPSKYNDLKNINDVRLIIMYDDFTSNLKNYEKETTADIDVNKFDKFLSLCEQVDSVNIYKRSELHER